VSHKISVALGYLWRGFRAIWLALDRGIIAMFRIVRAALARVWQWIAVALHWLRHIAQVVWPIAVRIVTALFDALKTGLIWTLDHLRDLLTALIHAGQVALTRLGTAIVNLGQTLKVGAKLLFHQLGQLFKRGGDRLEEVRNHLLAGMR
jgi:hypothetical protein